MVVRDGAGGGGRWPGWRESSWGEDRRPRDSRTGELYATPLGQRRGTIDDATKHGYKRAPDLRVLWLVTLSARLAIPALCRSVVTDNDGWTALMVAAQNGHARVVDQLLDNKADTEVQSKKGSTALMIAAHNGRVPVVKQLLDNKANIEVQNEDGWTAPSSSPRKRQKTAHGSLRV